MTRDLIILGAGGSSREIAGIVEELKRDGHSWKIRGFLDDDSAKVGRLVDGCPVLGPLEAAASYPDTRFVLGIVSYRNPGLRRAIVGRLALPLESFARLVHPTASVANSASLGHGSVVLQGVVITAGSVLGDHVLVSQGAMLGHDVTVGPYVTIAPGAIISGGVRIGESAYVGTGAIVAPGVTIGAGALVGMGAVVTADADPGSTVFGNPARAINRGERGIRRWAP
jgi:sugar O-acyltransferase (sialic acid O-acetyltransferase NeuD family)